jgi:Protein of unknown function (DUF1236)
MTKLRLLSTAAAILALGAGGAFAQGMKDQAPEKSPAAQRQAPAEKMDPSIHQKATETTGQGSSKAGKSEMKTERGPAAVSPQESSPANGGVNVKSKNEHGAASGNKSAAEKKSSTTGQGTASSAAKLNTEQRTKITTVIRKHKVQPAHLNISVHVGARVPASVHFYPLPVEVVTIYPRWRGYEYILAGNEILVVNPRTHEIVAVLEA